MKRENGAKSLFGRVIRVLLVISVLVPVGAGYANPIQWTQEAGGNGHWYDLVQLDGRSYDWCYLYTLARSLTHESMPGYLTTITSEAEQSWLFAQYGCELSGYIAMGAYQLIGSSEPDGGWVWTTGEAWDHANWDPGHSEPNNSGYGENVGMFSIFGCDGEWNDYCPYCHMAGCVIEYGGHNVATACPDDLWIPTEDSSWGAIKKAYR